MESLDDSRQLEVSVAFARCVTEDERFQNALEVARLNGGSGGVWLIGGYVYRNLAHVLHNSPRATGDLDFIIEKPAAETKLLEGWQQTQNRYHNPKLLREGLAIDLVPLDNISSIRRRGLEPTIDNFLTGTPLNVQSIAFDVTQDRIIGDIGIAAIEQKTVAVNDLEQARIYAETKGKALNEIILEKADALRFRPIIPGV